MRDRLLIGAALTLTGGIPGCGGEKDTTASMDAGVGSEDAGATDAPTWHQDIAPLIALKCTGCHSEGSIAPFSLTSYDTAKAWAGPIAAAVMSGSMPPFLAQETDDCKPERPWQNDIRLSDAEKELVQAWAKAGAPAGDEKAAAEITPPASVALEREDVIMPLPEDVTVEGKKDLHTCIIVDPKLTRDEWVVGRLITAGNAKVLHHVVSYVIEPGTVEEPAGSGARRPRTKAELEAAIMADKGVGIGGSYDCFGGPALTASATTMLDAWAPGALPNMSPPDSGQPLSKDALVLLDVHYHPIGAPQVDSGTKLSLMLASSKPAYVARTVLIGNFEGTTQVGAAGTSGGTGELLMQSGESKAEFMVPAGAKGHVEDMTWTWRLPLGGIRVAGMGTHMHYVGRKMRITLERAAPNAGESEQECLIETPNWDFNWQRGYAYDAPYEELPEMRDGDVLKFHCEFDNSMDNHFVREALDEQGLSAPIEVRLGEDTLDEMCLGAIGIMYPNVL